MRKSLAIAVVAVGALAVLGGAAWWLRDLLASEHSWGEVQIGQGFWVGTAGAAAVLAGLMLYGRSLSNTHDTPLSFLSSTEDGQVVAAIESFEKRTSGELRVHLEHRVSGGEDMMAAAKRAFDALGLSATRERNGVLFFVAVKERRFAVLGDSGIDQKVPAGFWDNVVAAVGERFKQAKFGEGLVEGVRLAGEQLAAHFPPRADDRNELPNQISRGAPT